MAEERETSDFDFDRWSKMAQQDPEKFEAMRQQLINDVIEQAHHYISSSEWWAYSGKWIKSAHKQITQ
ncbi:MAG: DUF3135 domain-containing protein, partial [Pseudomonadota bacterium]